MNIRTRKKDKSAKRLETHNDVFADVFNGLLFKDNVIQPERLKPGITNVLMPVRLDENNTGTENEKESAVDVEQNKEGYRDVCKIYEDSALSIVSLGIENQTTKDNFMPLRVMMYDCGEYLAQLANLESKKLPYLNGAITVVLNFSDRRWRKPRSLKDCIRSNKSLEPFYSDYKIHVIDINFLSDEEINCLNSDLRGILKVLKDIREDKFEPSKYDFSFKHSEDAYNFISTYLRDDRFSKMFYEIQMTQQKYKGNNYNEEGKEEITMCEALDKLMNARFNEGVECGIECGEIKGMLHTLSSLIQSNKITIEIAAEEMGISTEEFLLKARENGYELP